MSYNDRNFHIGQLVYRAKWDKIQEGIVVRIHPVSISNSGTSYDDPNGEYTEFVAQFGDNIWDWEGQTYAWKFFADKRDAYKRLAYEVASHIEEYKKKIREWESILYIAKECSK